MAEEQPQGNIKAEYNNASIGLNMDQTLNQIKPGTLTYALNAALENFDSSSVNYQNEQGNELCLSFPKNYVLIGEHFINEKSKHIFFLTNPNDGSCEIGYMDNNDCIYHTLINSACLNFNIDNPIHKVVHKIANCKTEIYWTDGYNPRRYLDIENIPYTLTPGSDLCNPTYTTEVDCNQLKIQPNFNIPDLSVVDITTGGALIAGTYQFAVQYADASGNPYTSYYSITNPTPIADISITTVNYNYNVGKSIVVDVSNLDTTGEYTYFNLAVIKTINAVSSVELVGTYFIDNVTKQVTYTGQDVTAIRLSINDIFEKFPYYDIAEDLTTAQDVLIWDGLVSIDRINYQEIATGITLLWETYKLPPTENYSDELNATNLRGYLRDEVYAFEIAFLLRNGKQTDGFHIPSREAISSDLVSVPNTNQDFIGEGTSAPYWEIYNTASVINTSPVDATTNIGNATAYNYGKFAYWESTEEYPCNTNVWGDLAGQKIRHHKFPDVLVSPITKPVIGYDPLTGLSFQNNNVFPIGVKIDITQVNTLIRSSSLTDEQKAAIVGFKILRGDRATNKSIVGKGILRNVNKYKREEQSFYFPNYPYNDLNADPFLNTTNNAWAKESQPFEINIFKFNEFPVGKPPYTAIQYIDPNTNKLATHNFESLGVFDWCSINKPTFLGNGPFNQIKQTNTGPVMLSSNVGCISYSNYDVWYLYRDCPGFFDPCEGWRAQFTDRTQGALTQVYLQGSNNWDSGYTEYIVYTEPGSPKPECIEYCGDDTGIDERDPVRVDACGVESPLPQFNNSYRQIFNSPETSFGQPFLGDTLKLENVMFGKGSAHFVQVRSNAKYRLLSKEAQEDALDSSSRLGAITSQFNATAMFTTYQAYLQIYINGITRRNYAQSFNSTASYDYNTSIPNNIGIKQRYIDLSRYLIPGVQNVGDDFNINNYQRESSVYLKTDESKTALPFPSSSVNMAALGVTDVSRFTIGDSSACATPANEQAISVVSYYASLKNTFVNQWGQIYSYVTIDTGFQKNTKTTGSSTIFGGDTFISRFAFKTKLPFFIDNRVNAPDDSDVFYDEIGNIAYPKYWHSARSILSDYANNGSGLLSNIISYKAHEFDCPNDPTLYPPPNAGSQRTFYDGYFYLFAYGVPNFYCESSYNTDLRQAFNNREGDFWPHVSTGIPDDWLQEDFVSIANDNTYTYNVTFSKQNKENTFTHLPPDWDGKACYTHYPFRAIYSDTQNTDADNRVNSWLTYRAVSYFDFPQNYGNLISLDGIQNRAILARFENKTLMYNNLLTIDTSNPQAAYVGNPMLFKGAPPIDFAETDLGYVGSQNKMLLKIPNGQITIDAKRGQVFLIAGTQAQDLSAFGSGMNRFFTDHLAFEILRYFPTVDTDNHFNGVGLHAVYDSKFDRVIITKLDYIPLTNNVKYNSTTKEFYIEELVGDSILTTVVDLKDSDYFCNKSWTLSFNMNTKTWISFHSYIPNWYIAENNFFYSGVNGCCDDFDFVAGTLVPTPPTTSTTTTIILDCRLDGESHVIDCALAGQVTLTDCILAGTGVVVIEPCVRPTNLTTTSFATGYNIISPPSTVISTGSQLDACSAITYIKSVMPITISINSIIIQVESLNIGETVYNGESTDCSTVSNGWYFTSESLSSGNIFNVVDGVITEIVNCNPATTTTTTTIACFSYTISKTTVGVVTVSYTDCSGVTQTVNIGNSGGGPSTQTFCARSGSVVTPPEVTLINNGPC
jgi:hypothetical protein